MKHLAMIILAPVAVLAACTQLSRATCEEGDWLGIGQRDGAGGRNAAFVERHVETCGGYGVAVDSALWEQGRQQGLRVFCTPQTQYEAGRAGRSFNAICAEENLPEHRAAYDKGRKYFELTLRIDNLRAEIRDLRRESDAADDPAAISARLELEAFMIRMDIDRLLRDLRQYESL